MTVHIALLRGINVGGKNVIKMAELKKVFEAIGLCDVQTYIQSGNVLFKSNQGEEFLRGKIEREIESVTEAGYEMVNSGNLSDDIKSRLQMELISADEYIKMMNI